MGRALFTFGTRTLLLMEPITAPALNLDGKLPYVAMASDPINHLCNSLQRVDLLSTNRSSDTKGAVILDRTPLLPNFLNWAEFHNGITTTALRMPAIGIVRSESNQHRSPMQGVAASLSISPYSIQLHKYALPEAPSDTQAGILFGLGLRKVGIIKLLLLSLSMVYSCKLTCTCRWSVTNNDWGWAGQLIEFGKPR
jgi:hypothetical protein